LNITAWVGTVLGSGIVATLITEIWQQIKHRNTLVQEYNARLFHFAASLLDVGGELRRGDDLRITVQLLRLVEALLKRMDDLLPSLLSEAETMRSRLPRRRSSEIQTLKAGILNSQPLRTLIDGERLGRADLQALLDLCCVYLTLARTASLARVDQQIGSSVRQLASLLDEYSIAMGMGSLAKPADLEDETK